MRKRLEGNTKPLALPILLLETGPRWFRRRRSGDETRNRSSLTGYDETRPTKTPAGYTSSVYVVCK